MGGQEDRLPRPSLFITCRLAQVVQKVKHRLQQRLQTKRKGANPYGASYQRGLRLRALSDLEKYGAALYRISILALTMTEYPCHAGARWN